MKNLSKNLIKVKNFLCKKLDAAII